MKILIASNGDPAALRAAQAAPCLLESTPSFTVLAVVPEAGTPFLDRSTTEDRNRQWALEAGPLANRTISVLGQPAQSRIAHGNPGYEIVKLAHSEAFHLVVVGASRRSAIGGLLHRSVSRYVADHASCPVLVVPMATERPD